MSAPTLAQTVEPGQSWAVRDERYEDYRYITVEGIDGDHAAVKSRHRGGRRSRIRLATFRTYRFRFCGFDGPGVLPVYTGSVANGCGNCPPKPRVLHLDRPLAVGFGTVAVTRDGDTVWSGDDEAKRVADAEQWARDTPGDWRILFSTWSSDELYQRQDDGWVLVWRGMGFA